MTVIDERTTGQVTREELALARAVLDGLPVDGPLLSVPAQRRTGHARPADPVGDAGSALLDVLEGGSDRLTRLAALLDAAATQDAVLR